MALFKNIVTAIWSSAVTLLGLLHFWIYIPRSVRFRDGCIEITVKTFYIERIWARNMARLMLVREDIVGDDLEYVRYHELQHKVQCDRLGPFMIVLYPLFSLVAWIIGADPYYDNLFEAIAYRRTRNWWLIKRGA